MAIDHKIRTGEGKEEWVELTPMKAIRWQCKECMGFQTRLIDGCTSPLCPLFPYRNGKNESIKRPGNRPPRKGKEE